MSDLTVGRIEQLTHTPGPWSVRGSRHLVRRIHAGNELSIETEVACVFAHEKRNTEADARLIAAAPDLLAALKTAVEIIRSFHDVGVYARNKADDDEAWRRYEQYPEMQQIAAALAKAEGRS